MPKFFSKPFASGGDRTNVPDAVQDNGNMSFTQGWGYDYERNIITDPAAKSIERGKMNYLFYVITEAIGELQRQGSSTWDESRIPYVIGSIVWFGNTSWISVKAENNSKPGVNSDWIDLSIGVGSGGGDFDSTQYYNKTDMDRLLTSIRSAIENINLHETGDIYPISRNTLNENEYICNGERLSVLSNIGIALNNLPAAFKKAWNISTSDNQTITLPSLVSEDVNSNIYSTLVLSPNIGIDKSPPRYPSGDETTLSSFDIAKFIPVIYIDVSDVENTSGMALYFEGLDPSSKNSNVKRVKFGLYNDGERYLGTDDSIQWVTSSISYTDADGKITAASAGSSVPYMPDSDSGIYFVLSFNNFIYKAVSFSTSGHISITNSDGDIQTVNFDFKNISVI